ncbi:unnamed protein product [Paramecium sonneborni]|uniref:Uncharacterized protein n=1 Tax=Paramecium sonneborni TaxID=65129 RepID=A0A8S1RQ32_9CILI|nr:unnamed protein product [Paramecium sonneborni]
MYCQFNEKEYYKIGGGLYDQEGNQIKIGKWIELDKKFNHHNQIINSGEYNIHGMKIGRWDIMYCKYKEKKYQKMQILLKIIQIFSGGGSYDQEGNQIKIGEWVKLHHQFDCQKQVTCRIDYGMNGPKSGIKR